VRTDEDGLGISEPNFGATKIRTRLEIQDILALVTRLVFGHCIKTALTCSVIHRRARYYLSSSC
jgi:hypothetical protein